MGNEVCLGNYSARRRRRIVSGWMWCVSCSFAWPWLMGLVWVATRGERDDGDEESVIESPRQRELIIIIVYFFMLMMWQR